HPRRVVPYHLAVERLLDLASSGALSELRRLASAITGDRRPLTRWRQFYTGAASLRRWRVGPASFSPPDAPAARAPRARRPPPPPKARAGARPRGPPPPPGPRAQPQRGAALL